MAEDVEVIAGGVDGTAMRVTVPSALVRFT
jgi:hypothetical protein